MTSPSTYLWNDVRSACNIDLYLVLFVLYIVIAVNKNGLYFQR